MPHVSGSDSDEFEIREDARVIQKVIEISSDRKRMDKAFKYMEDTKKELDAALSHRGILKSLKVK